MLDALSPQRRRVVLGVVGLAVLLVLALVVVLVVRAVPSTAQVPQDEPGPVLLVPGYGGNGDSLAPLAAALRTAGRQVVIVPMVGDGTGDLGEQARHLGAVAAQTMAAAGAPSVDLIGYSAGGVVARLWVRNDGGDAVARRVLTLGSPQHGTSQAALGLELAGGCPAACEQLVPTSDVLRRLNAGDETPAGPQWVTIRSTTDQVVTPTDSAALDGALNIVIQDLCPAATTSHPGLPGDPVVLAALATVLGVESPHPPSAMDC